MIELDTCKVRTQMDNSNWEKSSPSVSNRKDGEMYCYCEKMNRSWENLSNSGKLLKKEFMDVA